METNDNSLMTGEKMAKIDELSGSEALNGFMGWLTTRKQVETFSASHDAGRAAKLIDEFCKANELAEPRHGWSNKLIHPPTNGE